MQYKNYLNTEIKCSKRIKKFKNEKINPTCNKKEIIKIQENKMQ